TQGVLVGSLLGMLIFQSRVLGAQEPIRRRPPPRRGWWGTLTAPLGKLFGREKLLEPQPGSADEAPRLLASIVVAVVAGRMAVNHAPLEPLMNIRLGLPPGAVAAASVLLPFAVCLMLARTAFWFIDPKRKDPVLAEMELNELVWTELRPEL